MFFKLLVIHQGEDMKFTRYISLFALFVAMGLGLFSCTKEVESRPNYIFKPAPKEGVAAKIGSQEITMEELYSGIQNELYEAKRQVYEIKMNRLQGLILERLISADPRKEGLSNDQFLEQYILSDASPSQEEIQAFIQDRNIPQSQVTDEMRERVAQFIMMEKKKDMIDKWLGKKTAENPVEVYFERPQRPVFDVEVGDSPSKGRSDAAITIVEFSDFQCPFCSRGADIMKEVQNKYGNKVRVVFKNFPLPFHQHAHHAAQAGLCAHEQNKTKFWDMHAAMFADQEGLSIAGLTEKARRVGLNMDDFQECLSSERFRSRVDADAAQGRELGVQSTPTYFVNGMMVSGAQPLDAFSEIIDEILNR